MTNYKEVHNFLIENSKEYSFLKKCIIETGILKLKKNNLDLFSFIFKTVISQQISNSAAQSIWSRIQNHLKKKKFTLFDYYKDKVNRENFNKFGISSNKAKYMKNIFQAILSKKLIEKDLVKLDSKQFHKEMKRFKGIGDWSCNMIEIFYLKKINIWPENDFVINKISNLINNKENTNVNFKIFSPYLSILALHFWALNKRYKELE